MVPKRIIAVIPARGGSKGIPGKNLKKIAGRSLIQRTIESLMATGLVDDVYVSSDSEEILNEAIRFGAKAIKRPEELSGDQASSESALLHALKSSGEDSKSDLLVFCQATSPFIETADLKEAISKVSREEADVVFSATESHAFLWRKTDEEMVGINHDKSIRLRRQEMEPEFRETGAFYVMKTQGFIESKHRFFGRVDCQVTDSRFAIDIDESADLELARMLAKNETTIPDLSKIKALVTDFDGVHTNNLASVNQEGTESVSVNRSDGLGISILKNSSIKFLILSKEKNPVVTARAKKLGVDSIQGIDDKPQALTDWAKQNNLNFTEIAYVGNDINDIEVMKLCGISIAVADSYPEVTEVADWVLKNNGGQGAIREVTDNLILSKRSSFEHG